MYNQSRYIFDKRRYVMKDQKVKSKNMKPNQNVLNHESAVELILDNLPFSTWLKDEKGNYLAVNKMGAEMAGMSKEELIGKNDFDIFPKEIADIFTINDQSIINDVTNQTFETQVNGVWYEEYKSKVLGENGKVIGTTGYQSEITIRKNIEEALKESERSKAVLISNLPGVAFRCLNDDNWTMTFLSEGCYELTGYRPEELLQNKLISYYDMISSEHRDITRNKWKEDVSANLGSSDEYTIITKSGEVKWVWEQSVIVYDKDGNPSESEGFIMDITESKRAIAALNDREDRFRAIFDSAPLGIGIFGTKSGFIYQINPKFAEIIGRSIEELLTLDWKAYSHPDELAENIEKLNLLQNKKINGFSMNKRYIKPDGTIVWVNMTIVPFKEELSQDMHLCIIEDITEKKKRDDDIQYISYHDVLTGVYNRAFFEEEKMRFDLSRQFPISLIMGDVNGLKFLNDSFGHSKGDELLKEIAKIMRKSCRGDDIVARVGGDEFVILMTQTDEKGAIEVCNRIEKACFDYKECNDKKTLNMSISLGHSTKTQEGQKMDALLQEAEKMLYRKKNADRKKVKKETLEILKNLNLLK
jgi:diguanylate cyclase (GGDEF)-like protein/PAS domain S-box-containing protein